MISWILALIFFAFDVALVCAVRDLRDRLREEIATTHYLTRRLAHVAMAQNNPGAAAPSKDRSASSPRSRGVGGPVSLPEREGATAPVQSTPADFSTEGA